MNLWCNKTWKESGYFALVSFVTHYTGQEKMQKQSTNASLLYMEKEKKATHHVHHCHEASPGSTGCQLGRMSCEGTTVPALPRGKDLLYGAVWEKQGMNRETVMRKTCLWWCNRWSDLNIGWEGRGRRTTLQDRKTEVHWSLQTILLTHFPLVHPRHPHLCGGHLPVVQPMSWAVQLHWGALKKQVCCHNGDIQYQWSCLVSCCFFIDVHVVNI